MSLWQCQPILTEMEPYSISSTENRGERTSLEGTYSSVVGIKSCNSGDKCNCQNRSKFCGETTLAWEQHHESTRIGYT